jgi:hypothetical protein
VTREREAPSSPERPPAPNGTYRAPLPRLLALQRLAGNSAVKALITRTTLARQVGWTAVDPKSWNAGPRDVPGKAGGKGVKRIPIEGITRGHKSGASGKDPKVPRQDDASQTVDDPEKTNKWSAVSTMTPESSGGVSTGRAIVLIPNDLPASAKNVEVLFHLHGFTPGGRGRGPTGTGDPEDVSVARIAQQIEASGRPMIAILPQGTRTHFWDLDKFDLDKYIEETLGLVPATLWPGQKSRSPGAVILSAHSGGGDVLAHLMDSGRVPRSVTGLFLFDAIHDGGQDMVWKFLKSRLEDDLARLHDIWALKNASAAPEAIADEQIAWLQQSGFRFRGFGSAKTYGPFYNKKIVPLLRTWFSEHESQLGTAKSRVYKMLSSNFFEHAADPAGTEHEQILGGTVSGGKREHENLLDALKQLPGGAVPSLSPFDRTPAKPLPKTAGWSDIGRGSTNAATRTTKGTSIKRVPVKGIAGGRDKGNAVVLIPEWLAPSKTVEVLFHLHGHLYPPWGTGYENAEDESLYRIEQALDQFKAAKRPIIAVLPQGGPRSRFGNTEDDLNANVYILRAIAAVPVDEWPSKTVPQAKGIILSGHSGAGGRFASMFGTEKMPGGTAGYPGRLESFFSFDTINGKDGQKVKEIEDGAEYKAHVAFVTRSLDADLRTITAAKASGQKEAQIETKLVQEGFRFRAFYTGTPSLKRGDPKTLNPDASAVYADRYFKLARAVDDWFDAHATELGGKGTTVYKALRANYTIEPAGTEHMRMMGGLPGRKSSDPWTHENMRSALGGLPTVPQGG